MTPGEFWAVFNTKHAPTGMPAPTLDEIEAAFTRQEGRTHV
jgi:hypothetical protein